MLLAPTTDEVDMSPSYSSMLREFLPLPTTLPEQKHGPMASWFWSEFVAGHRVFWDGGMTRGMLASTVPWSNSHEDNCWSTGLWGEDARVVEKPDSWLDKLPCALLDGVIRNGKLGVFDLVPMAEFFASGTVQRLNLNIRVPDEWHPAVVPATCHAHTGLDARYERLISFFKWYGYSNLVLIEHHKLPPHIGQAKAEIQNLVQKHNQIVLRPPGHRWTPYQRDDYLVVSKESFSKE